MTKILNNDLIVFQKYVHWILVFGLLILAFIVSNSQYQILIVAYMLFAPWADKYWDSSDILTSATVKRVYRLVFCLICVLILIALNPDIWLFSLTTFMMAALPEEWFFRGYLQKRLGGGMASVFIASVLFSLAHMISVSWVVGFLVFIPSIVYGYVYKKTDDLIFVIFLHGISNIFYKAYLYVWVNEYLFSL